MADEPGSKSFQNFLLAWAVVASLAALALAVTTVFLLLRPAKQPSTAASSSARPKNIAATNRVAAPLSAADTAPAPPADDREKPTTAFSALPRGIQTFDGVTFQIRGPVNIIGTRAAMAGGRELAKISNQPVTGRGKRIHVLHSGDHGSSANGAFIWRLVLHYADGESKRFDFAYAVHIRNYWWRPNQGEDELSDPNSSITWTGTSMESDRKGARLRLSRTTLLNPKPEVDVRSADYVSLLGQSSAYVFAVTLSDDGPTPVATEPLAAPNVSLLPFLLQSVEDVPEKDASLSCVFECNGFAVRCDQAPADATGRIILDVPTDVVSVIGYTARSSAGLVRAGSIEVASNAKVPGEQLLRFSVE